MKNMHDTIHKVDNTPIVVQKEKSIAKHEDNSHYTVQKGEIVHAHRNNVPLVAEKIDNMDT